MAKRWFAERSITIESEQINLIGNTPNDVKVNGTSILTRTILSEFIDETLYGLFLPIAVPVNVPLTQVDIPPFVGPSVDGITRVGSNTYRVTKKGYYQFLCEMQFDIGASVCFQIRVDGVAYDLTQWTSPLLATAPPEPHFTFIWSQEVDAQHDFTFFIGGDSFPVAGTPPVMGSIGITLNHRNKPVP